MRDAGERIHDEQDILALGAKGLGNGGGAQGAANAQHRRMIGGDGDHDRTRPRVACELGFEEVGDFARAFTDQPDHNDIGLGGTDDHAEQHRFADTRSRHDADALALADRQHAIDRAHADIHWLKHAAAIERRLQLAAERPMPRTAHGPQPVNRLARAIDHAPEQRLADFGLAGRANRAHRRMRQQRRRAAEVHHQRAVATKANHFGFNAPLARTDRADGADRQ